jgi:hypothetical protein
MAEPIMIRGHPLKSTAVALLHSQGLPVSDITDEHLEYFFFIGSDGSPTGAWWVSRCTVQRPCSVRWSSPRNTPLPSKEPANSRVSARQARRS